MLGPDWEARNLLCGSLRDQGWTVAEAADGFEALERIETAPPDLILLDLMLPDVDGFAVCDQLKRNRETNLIPIIMVTPLHDAHSTHPGLRTGPNAHLPNTTPPHPSHRPSANAPARTRGPAGFVAVGHVARDAGARIGGGNRVACAPPPVREAVEVGAGLHGGIHVGGV